MWKYKFFQWIWRQFLSSGCYYLPSFRKHSCFLNRNFNILLHFLYVIGVRRCVQRQSYPRPLGPPLPQPQADWRLSELFSSPDVTNPLAGLQRRCPVWQGRVFWKVRVTQVKMIIHVLDVCPHCPNAASEANVTSMIDFRPRPKKVDTSETERVS